MLESWWMLHGVKKGMSQEQDSVSKWPSGSLFRQSKPSDRNGESRWGRQNCHRLSMKGCLEPHPELLIES